jgi:hypothetical protein
MIAKYALVWFAALCALITQSASAQRRVIRGTVLDVRDQPVPAAAILAAGIQSIFTDDSGRFRLEIPHRDKLTFDVRRVGYMPSRMGVAAGGDTIVSLLLLPATQRLAGVEVRERGVRAPSLEGFEQRMAERKRGVGAGHFITAADIEAMKAERTTQVVESVPSMIVRRVAEGRFAIFGHQVGRGAECPATVYLDGIRLAGGGEQTVDRRGRYTGQREVGAPIDQYITPMEIAGIEVYARGTFAPPQFQPPSDANATKCAIVVVWSKHR